MGVQSFNHPFLVLIAMIIGTCISQSSVAEEGGKIDGDDLKEIPYSIQQTSQRVLASCPLDSDSRFKKTLKDLQSAQAPLCNGAVVVNNTEYDTEKVLYKLREFRENEMFQVNALNQLLYAPHENYILSNGEIDRARLISDTCKMSLQSVEKAYGDAEAMGAIKETARPKDFAIAHNPCTDAHSAIAKNISQSVDRAIRQYKDKKLKNSIKMT